MSVFQTLAPLLVNQTPAPNCEASDWSPGAAYALPLCCCVPLALVMLFYLNVVKAEHTLNWSAAACVLGCVVMAAWLLLSADGKQAWRNAQCRARQNEGLDQ